jgi:hypothetical protein
VFGLRAVELSRDDWRALTEAARVARVRDVSKNWVDLEVVSAPTKWEVIVATRERRPPGEEGHRLMAFEAHLRSTLGLPIEVYSPAAGDLNKLRLKLQKQRGGAVDDWFARREQTRKLGLEG